MTTINAFHPDYAKTYMPDMLKEQIVAQRNSEGVSKYVERRRKTNPTHGTVFGISDKVVSLKPLKKMGKPK